MNITLREDGTAQIAFAGCTVIVPTSELEIALSQLGWMPKAKIRFPPTLSYTPPRRNPPPPPAPPPVSELKMTPPPGYTYDGPYDYAHLRSLGWSDKSMQMYGFLRIVGNGHD